MKSSTHLLLLLSFFVLSEMNAHAQLKVSGSYNGKNIYVQNPMNETEAGYCTDSISVNGISYSGNFKTSAYEIKLDSLGLQIGDSVSIHIFHQPDCRPKVLNNCCFFTPKTGSIEHIQIDPNGKLSWTSACDDSHTFIVEQYKWNRWVELSRLSTDKMDSLGTFSVSCTILHGENTFRVQLIQGKMFVNTGKVSIHSDKEKVRFSYQKETKTVTLSARTAYELYTNSGERVRQGEADSIDLSDLAKGKYYLHFDVSTQKIHMR